MPKLTARRLKRGEKCPICHHATWCTRIGDSVRCMRVESAHPTNGGGWLHRMGSSSPAVWREPAHTEVARPDWRLVLARCAGADVRPLADQLGVSAASLASLGVGFDGARRAWTFPMRDGKGRVCGVRLRREDGAKYAITGSQAGLFFSPRTLASRSLLVVVEGATDAAAVYDAGYAVLGRHAAECARSDRFVREVVDWVMPHRVVVIPDPGEVGLRGALRCAAGIARVPCSVRAIPEGVKDVRAWRIACGTMWRKELQEFLA